MIAWGEFVSEQGVIREYSKAAIENSGVSRVMMPQDLFHRRFPQNVLVLLLPKVVFLPLVGGEKSRGLQVLNLLVMMVNYYFNERLIEAI